MKTAGKTSRVDNLSESSPMMRNAALIYQQSVLQYQDFSLLSFFTTNINMWPTCVSTHSQNR